MNRKVKYQETARAGRTAHQDGGQLAAFRFDSLLFHDPPLHCRPLQIVHGFDVFLGAQLAPPPENDIEGRLDKLIRLGLGGVVTNVGFRNYLESPSQWDIFRHGLRAAAERGMTLWWYDEKGYPSGTAGGLVMRANPEFAALTLACYCSTVTGQTSIVFSRPASCRAPVWVGAFQGELKDARSGLFVDLFDNLDPDGTLRWTTPKGDWTVLYIAERVSKPQMIPSGTGEELRHYVNLLDREVTAEFIRVTYDAYLRETPPELWKHIQAVFTDEPALEVEYGAPELPRGEAAASGIDRPPRVPWLKDFPAEFQKSKGYDLRPNLYALFCGETEDACFIRQDFYDVVTRLYAGGYHAQIADWCRANGIAYSGHILNEEWIGLHVGNHGSLFAALRRMDIPGIDLLNQTPAQMMNGLTFMTAKQAGSVAHLTGARETHCESSGGMPLDQRMGQGNLLHVLGINQITSYWGWNDIGEDGYRRYNDYMGRLALLMRGGRHACDVALLYPIRGAQSVFVPRSPVPEANVAGKALEERLARVGGDGYAGIARDLLRAQVDFDIVDEQAIEEALIADGALRVADEAFRIVIVSQTEALGAGTAEKLADFARAGGTVFFAGAPPVRAESAESTQRLLKAIRDLEVSGRCRTAPLADMPAAARAAGADDLTLEEPDRDILFTHRILDGRDIYFVINNSDNHKRINPRLREPGDYILCRPLTADMKQWPGGEIEIGAWEGIFLVEECKTTKK